MRWQSAVHLVLAGAGLGVPHPPLRICPNPLPSPAYPAPPLQTPAACHYNHVEAGRDWPDHDKECSWTCGGHSQSPINVPMSERQPLGLLQWGARGQAVYLLSTQWQP